MIGSPDPRSQIPGLVGVFNPRRRVRSRMSAAEEREGVPLSVKLMFLLIGAAVAFVLAVDLLGFARLLGVAFPPV